MQQAKGSNLLFSLRRGALFASTAAAASPAASRISCSIPTPLNTDSFVLWEKPKVLFLKSPLSSKRRSLSSPHAQTLPQASQEPRAIAKPQVRQTPPRAGRDWRWSFPHWGSGLQRHHSSHPSTAQCHQPQPAGEQGSSPADIVLQCLCGSIPETAAPHIQPGKWRRWDARKASSPKSSKTSARIHDRLRCIFRHEKQMLKEKPE